MRSQGLGVSQGMTGGEKLAAEDNFQASEDHFYPPTDSKLASNVRRRQ